MPRLMPRPEFETHILNGAGLTKATAIAQAFSDVLDELESVCGSEGREMAIVRTKLEEASFYAKRSMSKRTENQARTNG